MFAPTTRVLLLLSLLHRGADSFAPPAPATGATTTVARRGGSELRATATTATKDVEALLSQNRGAVDALASADGDASELTRLRFALGFDTVGEAKSALREAAKYRSKGVGKAVADAALEAYETATIGGGWDNDVVRDAAPHSKIINKFITPKNIVTMSTADGDLVYVIRASNIDDKKMMDNVSVDQLSEFFLYVKEVHNLVANARSEQTGRLCEVIFANDITGVRKAPDGRFSKALSSSSGQYEKLYPSLAGPTLITNLPRILQAFVAFFKPLFPKAVQERLKFVPAPVLKGLDELTPLASDKGTAKRFLAEIEDILRK